MALIDHVRKVTRRKDIHELDILSLGPGHSSEGSLKPSVILLTIKRITLVILPYFPNYKRYLV